MGKVISYESFKKYVFKNFSFLERYVIKNREDFDVHEPPPFHKTRLAGKLNRGFLEGHLVVEKGPKKEETDKKKSKLIKLT